MSTFYNAKVVKIQKETEDAVSVYFKIDDANISSFEYLPGQYITIEQNVQGEEIRRAYSLCTSPLTDSVPAVTVKKVQGGRMSHWINTQLKEGDTLKILAPEGRFTPNLHTEAKKQYMLFAGGSGITPILSIIKSVLQQEPHSQISLFYANKNKNSVIFKDTLEQIAKSSAGRLEITHIYDSVGLFGSGTKGPLKADLVTKLYTNARKASLTQEAFICGPAGMMDAVKNGLKSTSIPDELIHIEYFVAPGSENKTSTATVESNSISEAEVELKINGSSHTFHVGARKTILAGAQDAGLDPPYSCEAGICSTCMAKVTEGSVKMIENNILTQKEVDAGYVLTCQALCTSPKVKIEFFE